MANADTIEIKPHPGPQTAAHASSADILIYGGGAGGGKTRFLVVEPTRHAENKGFRGAIFRRTYPQITGQGGIWDEAREVYPHLGAKMREGSDLDATFPSGARIAFCHLQHEKTKYEYQGHQIAYLGFDELTHFTESQFFYLLSRNRSNCGIQPYIRATCNPDGSSWVFQFISWWIDPELGTAIPERCGKLRYFVRVDEGDGDELHWADSKAELIERFPEFEEHEILSVSFIEAGPEDNPSLDKHYIAKLKSLPRLERDRLLGRNWLAREGSLIDTSWWRRYTIADNKIRFSFNSMVFDIPISACRRIATIDTAGTSKEKALEAKGDPPSWSVCGIWDSLPMYVTTFNGQRIVLTELLFLRYVWRDRVDWNALKTTVPDVLQSWGVQKAYIENAHYGQPLSKEIRGTPTELVGPVISGMDDSSRGAKLERAVASTMLTKFELGKLFIPEDSTLPWVRNYYGELAVWTGMPKETADQVDITSYACYVNKRQVSTWGGTIKGNRNG